VQQQIKPLVLMAVLWSLNMMAPNGGLLTVKELA
jgi:hypothetical protein